MDERLQELILYISVRSEDDPLFDTIKLCKIMFAVDMFAHAEMGASITGTEYVKHEHNPTPVAMDEVLEEMITERRLAMQYVPYAPYEQKRPVALRRPSLTSFTADEIAMVDLILDTFRPTDTRTPIDRSHGVCGWAMAEVGEVIPYSVVFISDHAITTYEMELGRKLAQEKAWDVF